MKLLGFILFFVVVVAVTSDSPKTKIKDGKLKGKYMVTRTGRKFSGFLAIPFAKPPLGDLRFKVSKCYFFWGLLITEDMQFNN